EQTRSSFAALTTRVRSESSPFDISSLRVRSVAWSKTSSITFLSSESLRRYLLSRSDFRSLSRRLELSSSLNDWTLQVEKKKASGVSLGKKLPLAENLRRNTLDYH